MKIFAALFFAVTIHAAAQSPQVPHKMEFAGMTLTIRDDARREIQKDVDAMTKSPKHFTIKVEKAKTYFPIIEKIFADEGVPDDFKYLALQESSLIPDAVSTSNAVGFWQFKDFTAIEMGLRVDKVVDERMNIASSTRAAARYIKKNNTIFNNWLYALQSYQMGAGGVMRSEDDTHNGEKHAEITSKTYWYVKKFLAHKIAYQDAVKGKGQLQVTVYENKAEKSTADLASELSVSEAELKEFNKWIRSGKIPADRTYVVVVPGPAGISFESLPSVVLAAEQGRTKPVAPTGSAKSSITQSASTLKPLIIKINGIEAILAVEGDNAVKIASRAKADLASFLRWNEISYTTQIIPGMYYFVRKKRARASEDYHTLRNGESLWMVSQKYGVRMKKLRRFNRLSTEAVATGTTLWLSSMKPKSAENQVVSGEIVEVNDEEAFNWTASPDEHVIDTLSGAENSIIITAGTEIKPELAPLENEGDSSKTLQLWKEDGVVADRVQQITVTPPPDLNKTEHVVQAKETLYAIAKLYNVGVMDLVNWNNLDLQEGLRIGQVLRITSGEEAMAQAVTTPVEVIHEVMASDTLYSIARKYGVTIKDLMAWNEKKDFSVSVGEKLKVKQGQ